MHEGRDHLLAAGWLSRQNLLQGTFDLLHGHESLEFGANDPLPIDNKNPWLCIKPPLFHSRKHFLLGEVLPNLLMNKGQAFAVGYEQCPHDINHWPAHAASTELRRGEDDKLR